MKYIVVLILFFFDVNSAELVLNRYTEKDQSIDIYHVVDTNRIDCKVEYIKDFKKLIRCDFSSLLKFNQGIRNEKYFDIEIKNSEILFYSKRYAKLLPVNEKIVLTQKIEKPSSYRHWVIIGSYKKPSVLDEMGKKNFNFPLEFKKQAPPFIGALDLNGEPIKNKKDAITLSHIKKLFARKKFHQIVKLSDKLQTEFGNDFKSEIELYKLRSLAKIAQEDHQLYFDLKNAALDWINNNPSNHNIPEAYMYVVMGSFGLGRVKNGERYLKILTDGFTDNKFTFMAMLLYADRLYKTKKKRNQAIRLYKDVLYGTDDVSTASLASQKLANSYLDKREPKKAQKIFEKVLKNNPDFIKKDKESSFDIAKRFAENNDYETALKIVKILREDANKVEDEVLLKTVAYWQKLKGEGEKAIKNYSEYIRKYPDGKFINFVKKDLDSILIDRSESNLTKKLVFLNDILQKYEDKSIREKALERKVIVLDKLQKYDEILNIGNLSHDKKLYKYISKAAEKAVIKSLKEQKCEKAMLLKDEYNITIPASYNEEVFKCYMKTAKYKEALNLATQESKTKQLDKKVRWLYLISKLYEKMDENKKVILAANDVLRLSRIIATDKYDDILYNMANAYYNLKHYDDLMLESVQKIEQRFPYDVRNIDLYMKVLRYAKKTKKNMLVLNFAKKVIDLQKKYKIKSYSPKIEITYIHALQKIRKYKEGLKEVLKLLTKKLTDRQKAEVLYLAGEISISLQKNENAKEFFAKCGEVVQESSWQKLCAQNLELLTQ